MIIQSHKTPDLLLPDMTFWTMTINQPVTEIYKNYKMLCPLILYAEIYNDTQGANKRLKKPFEVFYIEPWQILVKNELEGRQKIQRCNIDLAILKSEQDMDEEERDNVEFGKELVETFDNSDRVLSAYPRLSNKNLASFANAPYQDLTWNQFIERFKTVSRGTIFENVLPIAKTLKANKNTVRTAIEKFLSEYAKMYPINNFQKAFAFSKLMLETDFTGICDRVFIPMLEGPLGFDRTHWDNTQNNLTDSHIRDSFPYTGYALYHHLAFHVYQNENAYNARIGARDFEYLYYLYLPNVLFVSADAKHKEYITEAGILKSRRNGSFASIPSDRDQNPEEHDRVMKYIKEGTLY
jgi:hypothetical protein